MLLASPVDSALPEPLRQLQLSLPLALFGVMLAWLFLGSLLQRVAADRAVSLRSPTLASLSLISLLAPLPWVRSLLWLGLLWFAVSWTGALLTQDVLPPTAQTPRPRPASRFLRRGLLADGLFALTCALFFWAQGGAFSRAGQGFVAAMPPSTPATGSQVGAADATRDRVAESTTSDGRVSPNPSLDLSAEGLLRSARSVDEESEIRVASAPPAALRQHFGHKRFLGLPLHGVLLALWLLAIGCKMASGLSLVPSVQALYRRRAPSRQRAQALLPCVSPVLLALHLWLCIRGLW